MTAVLHPRRDEAGEIRHALAPLEQNERTTVQTWWGAPARETKRGFFPTAQALPAAWSAPFASAAMPAKILRNADREPCGPGESPDARETARGKLSTKTMSPYASTGSVPPDAAPPTMSTSARAAGTKTTALTDAISQRRREPLTPYNAIAWEQALSIAGLSARYPDLVLSLQHGFHVGIPPISITHTPPNHPSLIAHRAEFERIIQHEIQRGRYLGPTTRAIVESCMGPFQTSPLSLVPKPHKPNTFRPVQNFSFPYNPSSQYTSINYSISSSNYPCTWGTFSAFALLCHRLPPGSQGAVRDVAEAYRTIPLDPSQWPGAVLRYSDGDEFIIDSNAAFGVASNGGVYGHVADAGADIMRSAGIGPIAKWVDDHTFLRIRTLHLNDYNRRRDIWRQQIERRGGQHHERGRIWFGGDTLPDGRLDEFVEDMAFPLRDLSSSSPRTTEDMLFTYSFTDINDLSSRLGIPWQEEKDHPFSSEFPFTGFSWNLETKVVAIPPLKAAKYLRAIEDWRRTRTHTLEDVQKLYGKLLHASLVVPAGRAYLTNLEAMLGIFHNNPFLPRTPPSGTPADLQWWAHTLAQPVIRRPIPGPCEVLDVHAFSDASSGIGIGIVIGARWRAWKLLPGWQRDGRDIGWAEAIGFEFLVRCLLRSDPPYTDIVVFGDNIGVVEGWWNGRSRNKATNEVFKRIHTFLEPTGCRIHTRYVESAFNPADDPSRGRYPPAHLLLPPFPIPAETRPFLADVDSPCSARESPNPSGSTSAKARPTPSQRAEANRNLNGCSESYLWEFSYWDD